MKIEVGKWYWIKTGASQVNKLRVVQMVEDGTVTLVIMTDGEGKGFWRFQPRDLLAEVAS